MSSHISTDEKSSNNNSDKTAQDSETNNVPSAHSQNVPQDYDECVWNRLLDLGLLLVLATTTLFFIGVRVEKRYLESSGLQLEDFFPSTNVILYHGFEAIMKGCPGFPLKIVTVFSVAVFLAKLPAIRGYFDNFVSQKLPRFHCVRCIFVPTLILLGLGVVRYFVHCADELGKSLWTDFSEDRKIVTIELGGEQASSIAGYYLASSDSKFAIQKLPGKAIVMVPTNSIRMVTFPAKDDSPNVLSAPQSYSKP